VPTKWRLRLATRRRSSSRYRELTSEEQAEKWFGIMPKEGQWENTLSYDRKKRRVILNGIERV
jgi:hypothetical protein